MARAKKQATAREGTARKTLRLDRVRRTLDEIVPSPPSSLDMECHGSAARTGRAELAGSLALHRGMGDFTGGDVDVDIEGAYFSGDEAPGGDNPTPDQDVVDDIGKALDVRYQDNEELKASDKIADQQAPLGNGHGLVGRLQGQKYRPSSNPTTTARRHDGTKRRRVFPSCFRVFVATLSVVERFEAVKAQVFSVSRLGRCR